MRYLVVPGHTEVVLHYITISNQEVPRIHTLDIIIANDLALAVEILQIATLASGELYGVRGRIGVVVFGQISSTAVPGADDIAA